MPTVSESIKKGAEIGAIPGVVIGVGSYLGASAQAVAASVAAKGILGTVLTGIPALSVEAGTALVLGTCALSFYGAVIGGVIGAGFGVSYGVYSFFTNGNNTTVTAHQNAEQLDDNHAPATLSPAL